MLTIKTLVRSTVIVVLAFTYFAMRGNGTAVHLIDVSALVESSDLIVVGHVTSISEQGRTILELPGRSIPAMRMSACLTAEETIKGSIQTPNLCFEFARPDRQSGIQEILRGQYGVFFLHAGAPEFTLSDPAYAFVPAVPGGHVSDGPPVDRIAAKLGEVVGDPSSTEREINSAIDALGSLDTKAARETLRNMLKTTSSQLQLRIASKLVARNDISGLDLVENSLRSQGGSTTGGLAANLAISLAGLKDPRSVPALGRLLRMNDPQITRSAVIALRQSRSPDALGPLSGLLGNGEEQVRYYAVVAMGEITGQDEWTPSFEEFHDHEAKYLSYWRDWAQSNVSAETAK